MRLFIFIYVFQRHVYQPLFTLVGGGIKHVSEAEKWMADVLPRYCVHYKTKVAEFDPEANEVKLEDGHVVIYMYYCPLM